MGERLRIVAMLFPGVTQLDLTAPVQTFSFLSEVRVGLARHRIDPVPAACGFPVQPTMPSRWQRTRTCCSSRAAGRAASDPAEPAPITSSSCAGRGALELMAHDGPIGFMREQAAGARYLTRARTGAFVLGSVGLLRGRRATMRGASPGVLPLLGAIPARRRVCCEGRS